MDFIAKYWIEFCFGLIAASLIWFIKNYYKLKSKDTDQGHKDLKDDIVKVIDEKMVNLVTCAKEGDSKLKEDVRNLEVNMDNLKQGLLSVQGKNFRDQCIELLEKDHEITIEEYEQFGEDYAAYKALKGNHKGDALHEAVVSKFKSQIEKGNADE